MMKVKVLYEHGAELNPYCSGHIRLLRPLEHPSVRARVQVTAARRYEPAGEDVVIVERLWRPGVTVAAAAELVERVRRAGARLVWAQDDNIFDLHSGMAGQTWLTDELQAVMELFARESAGVLTSTDPLKQRIVRYNGNVAVVPNALDERLLTRVPLGPFAAPPGRRLVIGYMGTRSHDEDLQMVLPALRAAHQRLGDRLELQIVGGLAHEATLRKIGDLPIRILGAAAGESDYPLFMQWFTSTIRWDVAIAPLRDNPYNVCKSDIKLLDYGSVGAPAIYSRLAPYDSVTDGVTGLVVDNSEAAWVAALERLLGDAELRERIARTNMGYLFGERTLARRAREWPEALEQLL
jgi:glycosyltransferase involved in cell wall biosynthesis